MDSCRYLKDQVTNHLIRMDKQAHFVSSMIIVSQNYICYNYMLSFVRSAKRVLEYQAASTCIQRPRITITVLSLLETDTAQFI